MQPLEEKTHGKFYFTEQGGFVWHFHTWGSLFVNLINLLIALKKLEGLDTF